MLTLETLTRRSRPSRSARSLPVYAVQMTMLALVLGLAAAGCNFQEYDRSLSAPDPQSEALNASTRLEDEVLFNPWTKTSEDRLATFSVDVDTASYTLMRRKVNGGALPSPNRVRTEEFVNYFKYDYPAPAPEDPDPFSITLEAAPSYFGDGLHMLRVGIKGRQIPDSRRPVANVVLLIDVSGSMQEADRIGYVKYAAKTLVGAMSDRDIISIVTYAGDERVVLEPTEVANRARIINAIDGLTTEGSTNGEAGIRKAYELADRSRCTSRPLLQADCSGAINRVVLATDGDFNVGVTENELVELVSSWRDRGIFLSALGVGNDFNDRFLEELTNRGNGNYYYLDSLGEARRVLEQEFGSTMQVIAKDVKVQVEFNPEVVERYRLVGYENRVLNDEDFANDKVDAGEIGSGHAVTAYLEFEMKDGVSRPGTGILQTEIEEAFKSSQFIDVRVRYKDPAGTTSREVVKIVPLGSVRTTWSDATADFRFGAAVSEFAEILRGSPFAEGARFDEVRAVAEAALGNQAANRQEFLDIVTRARDIYARGGLPSDNGGPATGGADGIRDDI